VRLKDKRILILGGTSGIGLAVADASLKHGAEVIVVSSDRERVDSALTQLGAGATGFDADLSSEAVTAALFSKIGAFDHLAFTAGDTVLQRPASEMKLGDAKNFFGLRFWGAFLAVQYGAGQIRPGGSIVLTSSTLPRRPSAGFAVGAGISAATEGFARGLAVELAPVRVNVVAPGIVRTPIWDRLPEEQREAFFAARAQAFPVGHVGDPTEIAEAYLFLMQNSFITGQVVVADGGMLLV
jgi:NAD(P)-dependent dehydrogenase (short-subunit alcohol dehydrogenase family)